MVSYIILVLFLIGPQLIHSITVSPESDLKNTTNQLKLISKNINKENTANLTKSISLTERNRRLIPYMTFYIPTNDNNYDAIDQLYNHPSTHLPNKNAEQNQQFNYAMFQQEQQSVPINDRPTVDVNNYYQQNRQQHSQQTYSNDEVIPSSDQIYNQMRLAIRPHHIASYDKTPSHSYDNIRQQESINQYSKALSNQPPYHHRQNLLHQHQLQQHDTDTEGHLPVREHSPKYYPHQTNNEMHIRNQLKIQQDHQTQPEEEQEYQNQQKLAQPIQFYQDQRSHSPVLEKLYSSPFTPYNKVPGDFTPILYINGVAVKPQHHINNFQLKTVNDEISSSNININKNPENGETIKQGINSYNDNRHDYLKQSNKIYKSKPFNDQNQYYAQQQFKQEHQNYKYPAEYTQHNNDNNREEPLLRTHQNLYKNNIQPYRPYNNKQSINTEDIEPIISILPAQQQSHTRNNQQNIKHHKVELTSNQFNENRQNTHQNEHVHNIISTTQRPTYKLVTENAERYNYKSKSTPHTLINTASDSKITPQEQYVAYLNQQYKQKYQNRYKDYEATSPKPKIHNEMNSYSNIQIDPYLNNASPSKNPPQNNFYSENQKERVQYTKYVHPVRTEEENQDKPNENNDYIKLQEIPKETQPNQGNFLKLVNIHAQGNKYYHQNQQQANQHFQPAVTYLHPSSTPQSYLVPVKQEKFSQLYHADPNQKDIKHKELYYVTTENPLHATSVGSVYKFEPNKILQHINIIKNKKITSTPSSSTIKITSPTNSPSFHLNSTIRPNEQNNGYNVQPTRYENERPPTIIIKPTYLTRPLNSKRPEEQELKKLNIFESNKIIPSTTPKIIPSFFQSNHYYKPNENHNKNYHNYHNQQNKNQNKFLHRQHYSHVTSKLKLKPLQKTQHSNQEIDKTTSITVTTTPRYPISTISSENVSSPPPNSVHKLPNFKESEPLSEILRKLQETNHLPQTITPDNIDNSIKTLIKILNNLKESQTIVDNPPQHHDQSYNDYDDVPVENPEITKPGPNSGRPGIDYPNLYEIPHTSFNCKEQRYKGFFGDPETNCQVWHYCDLNGGQASFLCPNGTIFSQVALTCDWWFNVKCSSTAQLYVLNERLYKYILPFTPKFPEDYSGPLVDKYLALKFKEMEEKMMKEKEAEAENEETNENTDNSDSLEEAEEIDTEKQDSEQAKTHIDSKLSISNSEKNNEDLNITNDNLDEVKSVNLVDVEENRGAVDTGIAYNRYSESTPTSTTPYPLPPPLTVQPIYVASTTPQTIVYSSTYVDSSPSSESSAAASVSQVSVEPISNDLQIKNQNRFKLRQRFKLNRNRPGNRKSKVDVESEKVEVIEIKTDGVSGHIIPNMQQTTEYTYSE